MTIAARQYSSGAEIVANANALRQKLMNLPRATRKPAPKVTILNLRTEPMWKKGSLYFDGHVKAWREYRVTSRCNRYKDYVMRRCAELCVDYREIVSPSMQRHLVEPRQLIWYEMRTKFGLSFPRIGREFGDRDHTTILAGIQRVSKRLGEGSPGGLDSMERLLKDRDLNEAVRADYRAGIQIAELGKKYEVAPRSITAVAKIESWIRGTLEYKSNTSRKVNMADLRRDWEDGIRIGRLVDAYGLSQRSIRRLAKNNGWVRKERRTVVERVGV